MDKLGQALAHATAYKLISREDLRSAIKKEIRAYRGKGKLFSSRRNLLEDDDCKLSLARTQNVTQASSSSGLDSVTDGKEGRSTTNLCPGTSLVILTA